MAAFNEGRSRIVEGEPVRRHLYASTVIIAAFTARLKQSRRS